eukprot:855629-Pleurochrysis_carterae.AAC.1
MDASNGGDYCHSSGESMEVARIIRGDDESKVQKRWIQGAGFTLGCALEREMPSHLSRTERNKREPALLTRAPPRA